MSSPAILVPARVLLLTCSIYPNFFPTVFIVTTSQYHRKSSCLLGREFRLIGELCVERLRGGLSQG